MGREQILHPGRLTRAVITSRERDPDVLDEVQEEHPPWKSDAQAEDRIRRSDGRGKRARPAAGTQLVDDHTSDICLIHSDEHRYNADAKSKKRNDVTSFLFCHLTSNSTGSPEALSPAIHSLNLPGSTFFFMSMP